jgi:hypothetical protein
LAVVEYSDDTGSEEEEHVVVDGNGQEMSDESSSEDDSDSDDEPNTLARYLRDPQPASVPAVAAAVAPPAAPAAPDPFGWDASDDQVGQQDAWEIVEILHYKKWMFYIEQLKVLCRKFLYVEKQFLYLQNECCT